MTRYLFHQWVANNFECNEDTPTGHDTTHVMGVITCQTPGTLDCQSDIIPRREVSVKEIVHAGNCGHLVKTYSPPCKSPMSDTVYEPLPSIQTPVHQFQLL